jgi:hypothetical protein
MVSYLPPVSLALVNGVTGRASLAKRAGFGSFTPLGVCRFCFALVLPSDLF